MNAHAFISDSEIDKALDFLRDNARDAAQARADRIYVEEYRKTLKSILMKEHGSLSVVLQERNAYADERYVQHLEAIRADEMERFRGKLGSLTPQQEEALDALTRGIIHKVAHAPITELRRHAANPNGSSAVELIRRLFRLD